MHTRNHNHLVSDYVCILYKYSMLCSDGAMSIQLSGTRMLMYFYIFSQENRMHITTIPVYYQVITQTYNHNSRAYLNKILIEQQNPGLF